MSHPAICSPEVGYSALRVWKARLFILLAIFSALAVPMLALEPDKPISQLSLHSWTTAEGLPQNSVTVMLQSRDGYLWLGTQSGLVRFDGAKFTVFDKASTRSMKSNDVRALLETADGALWVGTYGGGITRIKDGKYRTYTTEQGLGNNVVYALYEDSKGILWIGTAGGGLNRFENGRFKAYTTRDGLSDDRVFAICGDSEGRLWVGTLGAGLNIFENGKFTTYTRKEGMPSDMVFSLFRDREGTVWIGTYGGGLTRLVNGKFVTFGIAEGLPDDRVGAIHQDRDGNLWVGTFVGISRIAGGKFSNFAAADGLSGEVVRSIIEDREGNLWIGTFDGGLNRLRNGTFTTYQTLGALSGDTSSVFEDREGTLWIGSEKNGLARLRGDNLEKVSLGAGLGIPHVLSLWGDHEGGLWIGTFGQGLIRLKDGVATTFKRQDGLPSDIVYAIYEDRDHNVWIGTYGGGLSRYSSGKFDNFSTRDGLADGFVRAIHQDRSGDLWVGTNRGLNRLRDGKFTTYTGKDGLSDEIIMALTEDSRGTLWIGTRGGGLNRLENGRIRSYTTSNGLFDEAVLRIMEDDDGRLWLSSPKGVFSVSRQSLDDFDSGKLRQIVSVPYGTADGMEDSQCNGGSQPAGWRTRDGLLWFPTMKGAVVVDPTKVRKNIQPPPVLLESMTVNRRPVAVGADLDLPAGSRNFEFHYTALSFVAPEKMRFKYKLEGFDEDWIDPGTRRIAFYTNVPPGEYTFNVIASNNDGVWNVKGARAAFRVRPHFYETVWFYLLLIALVPLVAFLVYRYRVGTWKAGQKELARLVEERTGQLEEANRRLERISALDALTGISNRREFDRFIELEWRRVWRSGKPVSMIMGDIDFFKAYNDAYGHQKGDECLRAVAAHLSRGVSRAGDLVSRYGGEEFAIILPMTPLEGAVILAESLRKGIEALAIPHGDSDVAKVVTISLGVASALPGEHASSMQLVGAADRALYQAKAQGRNRVVVAGAQAEISDVDVDGATAAPLEEG